MRFVLTLSLFIFAACTSSPKQTHQVGSSWARGVAQTAAGTYAVSPAILNRSAARSARIEKVDISLNIKDCMNGCAYVVGSKNTFILWPYIELNMSSPLFISFNQDARKMSALYNSESPAHIVIHASNTDFRTHLANFTKENSSLVMLQGDQLVFKGINIIR